MSFMHTVHRVIHSYAHIYTCFSSKYQYCGQQYPQTDLETCLVHIPEQGKWFEKILIIGYSHMHIGMRAWFSGRMRPCQGRDGSSILPARTNTQKTSHMASLLCICAGRENRTPVSTLARSHSTTKPCPHADVHMTIADNQYFFKSFSLFRDVDKACFKVSLGILLSTVLVFWWKTCVYVCITVDNPVYSVHKGHKKTLVMSFMHSIPSLIPSYAQYRVCTLCVACVRSLRSIVAQQNLWEVPEYFGNFIFAPNRRAGLSLCFCKKRYVVTFPSRFTWKWRACPYS